jgi:hypothetical protein
MLQNTSGSNNSAYGTYALTANTTGSFNTANGVNALAANTTGNSNTAEGLQALYTNSSGSYNTATGYSALLSNSTASYNTAHGYAALDFNTTGSGNSANGALALYSNSTGSFNTAAGMNSMYSNTTGSINAAYGAYALYSNTSGYFNTGIGYESLRNNTTGNTNTGTGYQSLYWCNGSFNAGFGHAVFQNNTTGNQNTGLGAFAGYNNTGSGNVFIGYAAGYSATGSNQLWIANSNVGNPLVYGDFTSGNIGIGTTSPLSRLHVADVNSKITVDATGGGAAVASLDLKTLGAGTASLYKFNTGRLALASGGAYNMQFLNSIGGSYQFDEGVNTRLYIAAGGNVGINTTAPATNLHVAGTTRLADGSQGLDKVLRSDAAGNASWVNSSINTGFSAYASVNQSIGTGVWTQVNFGAEDFDDGAAFASNQYVCPTAGVYQFDASVSWSPFTIAGTWSHIALYKNGVIAKVRMETATTGYFSNNVSGAIKCNAGDVITVRVFQQSSGTESIYGSYGYSYFTGFRIY